MTDLEKAREALALRLGSLARPESGMLRVADRAVEAVEDLIRKMFKEMRAAEVPEPQPEPQPVAKPAKRMMRGRGPDGIVHEYLPTSLGGADSCATRGCEPYVEAEPETPEAEHEIHDEHTQRLSATGVAALYGVRLKVIAAAIHAKPNTLHKNPASESVQKELAVLVDCFTRLFVVMSQDEIAVRRWLNRPNRGLDGLQPIHLVQEGRLSDLKAVVLQIETAGYA